MTIWRKVCAVAAILLVVAPYSANSFAALKFDLARPIYDDNKSAHGVSNVGHLLSDAASRGQQVVLYLHGRGDEPEKSFNSAMTGGGAVARLRSEYKVRVILVNWNSKSKGKDRSAPLSHVAEGAATLDGVLTQLIEYQELNPSAQRPAFLVHSMGSIVLATYVKTYGWPTSEGRPLFSNVLLSEPDVDSQGHAEWLSKVASRERAYVTQNTRDSVLKASTDSRSPMSNFALGLEPIRPFASGAFYVDLTDALKVKRILILRIGAHQIFSKSWMGGNANTCIFVTKSLQGEKFEPDEVEGIVRTSSGRYRASENLDKKHTCFKNAVSGGDKE